jgi:DNA ligase-1
MKHIENLPELYKRDTNGKIRVWQIQVGYSNEDHAGTRTVSGLQDGQTVTSGWNLSEPKNVGKVNGTTSYTQAQAEAQAEWDKRIEREYFIDITEVDFYDKFAPMLANDYTRRPQSQGFSQPKLDGIRCVANAQGLWTRSGKLINSCPHIWKEVEPFFAVNPKLVLDGELYNHELKEDFNKIVSLVRKTKSTPADIVEAEKLVQYHVYDMYNGKDAELSFALRSEALKSMSPKWKFLKLVPTVWCDTQDQLDEKYGEYMTDGYEGQMVRNDTAYENKRSNSLLKRKEFITEEFPVVAVIEGQGNWAGYVKRFVLRMPDGTEVGAGVRGSQAQMKTLLESNVTPDWATLRYFGLTPDGVPRFPVVVDYGTGERTD